MVRWIVMVDDYKSPYRKKHLDERIELVTNIIFGKPRHKLCDDELVVVGATEGTYSIYSIQGKVMRRGVLSAHPITVQDLPQGMYVIEINRNFNLETLTKKFIKL